MAHSPPHHPSPGDFLIIFFLLFIIGCGTNSTLAAQPTSVGQCEAADQLAAPGTDPVLPLGEG